MVDVEKTRAQPLWLRAFRRVTEGVGIAFFLLAFVGFILQVFYRYVLNDPLIWSEEFTMICFMWAVFWATAFLVPIRAHVSFDMVYDQAPPRVRRVMAVFAMVTLIVAFVILIPYTYEYLLFLTRKKSPVFRLPMWTIYSSYLVFLVAFTGQAIWRLKMLLSRDWQRAI